MYITQTFMGLTSSEARVYVYFLSSGDRSINLRKDILKRITEFGLSTDENAAIIVPYDGYERSTLNEIEDSPFSSTQNFYKTRIRDKLPGLLLTYQPLSAEGWEQSGIYFSLSNVKHPLRETRAILQKLDENNIYCTIKRGWEKSRDFIIIEPSILGIGINVNKILDRITGLDKDID